MERGTLSHRCWAGRGFGGGAWREREALGAWPCGACWGRGLGMPCGVRGAGLRAAGAGQQPQAHAVNSQHGGGGGSGTRGLGHLAGRPRSLGGRLLCAARPWVEAVWLLDGPAGRPGDLGSGLDTRGRGGGLAEGLQL